MSGIKARPTVYKGIQMRSRLEADYAAHLDRNGEEWGYETECFASSDGQWLPDFRVSGADVLVEVKSAHLLELQDGEDGAAAIDRIDAILKRMTIAWESRADAPLELVFWSYGATVPVLIIHGNQHCPWLAYMDTLPTFPMIWPGMDQFYPLAIGMRALAKEAS